MAWADDRVTRYQADAQGVVKMPAEPVEPARAAARRGKPGCPDCLPDAACSRHGYDPCASLGIGPADPQDRVRWEVVL